MLQKEITSEGGIFLGDYTWSLNNPATLYVVVKFGGYFINSDCIANLGIDLLVEN
jgi:hypothetical protein